MIKQEAAQQHRKSASSRMVIAFSERTNVLYESKKREEQPLHRTKSHHIYFSLASWQFHMFYRCINISTDSQMRKIAPIYEL